MTMEDFRKRFDADRRDNELTMVADDTDFGIAVGVRSPDVVITHDGKELQLASLRFLGEPR